MPVPVDDSTAVLEPTEGIERPTKPAVKSRKRFVGSSKAATSRPVVRRVANQVPDDILHDKELNAAIAGKLIISLLSCET